jgi:photosystem II stability/assembly factor-like uncharacterized protein
MTRLIFLCFENIYRWKKLKSHELSFILLLFITVLMLIYCTEDFTSPPQKKLNDITNPPGGQIIKLGINSKGDFFSATETGLYISTDEGSNWDTIYTRYGIYDLLITLNDILFFTYSSFDSFNLLRSYDNGRTWDYFQPPHLNGGLYETKDGNIFSYGQDGLYRSSDLGETWDELYTGLLYCVCAPNDTLIIIAVPGTFNGQIVYSTDNGSSWNSTHYAVTVLEFYNYDSFVFAGGSFGDEGGGGVHKSSDEGITWESCGLDQTSVSSFVTNKQNELFIGTSEGIYFTDDDGSTWQIVLSDSAVTTLMKDGKSFLYAGTMYGTFLRSTDNGMSWHNGK